MKTIARPKEQILDKWLTDHNLVGDERLPDLLIAGTIAIHFQHDRSPQSYAYDRYYFAKSGQLYMVVIGHSEDKEDWELYNHFLESIQFSRVRSRAMNQSACKNAPNNRVHRTALTRFWPRLVAVRDSFVIQPVFVGHRVAAEPRVVGRRI